jgi:hypothetical protein
MWSAVSLPLTWWKSASKKQMLPQKQGKSYCKLLEQKKKACNVLNWSDKVKTWDLCKSLLKVGWPYRKNGSSIHSTALNSVHPEQAGWFLHCGLLGAIYSQIKKKCVCCLFFLFSEKQSELNYRYYDHCHISSALLIHSWAVSHKSPFW